MCRPVGLSYEDRHTVCRYAINRIGFGYDTKNIIDLMRYLFPMPVPQRWRRRMIAFGSGDPTKIICSALIAQAFDTVRYPILPKITTAGSRQARREILHIRHSSLYMPRDFDISPYFEIVKPTIVAASTTRGCIGPTSRGRLRKWRIRSIRLKTRSPSPLRSQFEQAPAEAAEVRLIERVRVTEHYLVVDRVPACALPRHASAVLESAG